MSDRRLGVMAIVAPAVLAVLMLNLVAGRDPLVTNALRLAVTALFWGIWAEARQDVRAAGGGRRTISVLGGLAAIASVGWWLFAWTPDGPLHRVCGLSAIAGAVLLVIAWLAPRRAINLIERGRVARP